MDSKKDLGVPDSFWIRCIITETINQRTPPRHGGWVTRKPTLDQLDRRRERAPKTGRPTYQPAYGIWSDDDE